MQPISRSQIFPLRAGLAAALILFVSTGCTKSDSGAAAGAEAAHAHTVVKDGVVYCTEHNVPEAQCGICKPQLAPTLKPGEALQLRLAATDSAAIAGVEHAEPAVGALADAVEAYAEFTFNQNRLAQLAAPAGGLIAAVTADLGTRVPEGQVVARVWSPAIAEAMAKAGLSHQTLARERRLRTERITSEQALQEAEAAHRAACQPLLTMGFTEEQIDSYVARPQERVLLDIRAPFAGEIIERTAVLGALCEAGKPLFTLADRSTMWAMLNIPEAALARVQPGQTVELRVAALPGRVFRGTLTWVAAAVDEPSRMARARVEVPNPDGALRARMFAQARILTGANAAALHLPADAIQRIDGRPFVFVRRADDLYDARAIALGVRSGDRQEIAAGLRAGERVAVRHVFPLKSALLISRLGAGCADD